MGVDTRFFTSINNGAEDVMLALKTIGAKGVRFTPTHTPYYVTIEFNYKDENRSMSFFQATSDYAGITMNLMSFSHWGHAEEIMEKLAKMMGGLLQRQDCTEDFEMFDKPGQGNFRWLLDRYYLENENTPRNSEQDVEGFVKWLEEHNNARGNK